MKAGLKLHEEAEKKEVEQGIHLLQDPEGKNLFAEVVQHATVMFASAAIEKKVKEAQRQRQAAAKPKAMEVEATE